MHIIEDWGTGIRRMIGGCRDYGIRDPEFIELGTMLRVNIYRDRKYNPTGEEDVAESVMATAPDVPNSAPINDTEAFVLAIIREKPYITTAKLAELISKTEKTAERNLTSLKQKGRILRIGSKKNGYWEITQD
jgi:predicted HTH transcriptional regulator